MQSIPIVKNRLDWPWSPVETIEYDKRIKWPKISIITPSFNQGQFLEQTIRSVLMQGYPNLEYIIIDGGSIDNSIDIIKKYEHCITFWQSENDLGQSDALNKGLNFVSGEIFNWINSDDWYEPNTFLKVALSFLDNPMKSVVSGCEYHVFPDASRRLYSGTIIHQKIEDTINQLHISQPSTFFKLDVFKKLGYLSLNLHFRMDTEIWLRYLLLYGISDILKTEDIYVNFRFHENSKSTLNLDDNYLGKNFEIELNLIRKNLFLFVGLDSLFINYFIPEEVSSYRKNISLEKLSINNKYISKKRIKFYYIKKYINSNLVNYSLVNVKTALRQNDTSEYSLIYYLWFYFKYFTFKYLKRV